MRSDVNVAEPSASWPELSENGWGALMGWAAGEENLRRHPISDAGRTVTGYIERAGERNPLWNLSQPLTGKWLMTTSMATSGTPAFRRGPEATFG
jgi:hypothetical protein